MSTIDRIIQLLKSQQKTQKNLTDYLGIDSRTMSDGFEKMLATKLATPENEKQGK